MTRCFKIMKILSYFSKMSAQSEFSAMQTLNQEHLVFHILEQHIACCFYVLSFSFFEILVFLPSMMKFRKAKLPTIRIPNRLRKTGCRQAHLIFTSTAKGGGDPRNPGAVQCRRTDFRTTPQKKPLLPSLAF